MRALLYSPASSFSPVYHKKYQLRHFDAPANKPTGLSSATPQAIESASTQNLWATHALLFSSWTDGVAANPNARAFLKYCVTRKMLSDKGSRQENVVKSSVEFSPCNGPDVDALNNLELVDKLIELGRGLLKEGGLTGDGEEINSWSDQVLHYLLAEMDATLDLRLVYIPTAMYALNPQSCNTPGKQRQRARADAKKRRDKTMNVLNEIFNTNDANRSNLNICAVSLDLDDGSLKQPVGFSSTDLIPKDDKDALSRWNPHIVYVEGGNTFFLQHCIEKGNYSKLMTDVCTGPNGAVYCGKSAGAIVAGRYVETATWKGWDDPSIVPGKENYDKWFGCKGFEFVGDSSFFPHMSSDWDDLVQEMKASKMSNTICLREEDVCCTIGESGLKFVTSGQGAV